MHEYMLYIQKQLWSKYLSAYISSLDALYYQHWVLLLCEHIERVRMIKTKEK